MTTEPITLNMTPIGMIFHIVKTAEQTHGQSLEMEWELLPKADGTPVHIHPQAAESYKVLAGRLEISVNGKWQLLKAGDNLTVPAGVPHTFRNPLPSVTRVYNTHSPAMEFSRYFNDLNSIINKLTVGDATLKMNLTAVTYMSMLMKKYPKEIVSVKPPNFLVTLLAAWGRLRGLRV